jgi:AcrR family transcriptional regulator
VNVGSTRFPAGEQPGVARIRDAALKIFARHGTEAASLRMVAVEAGVGIGLVQRHFGSRPGLIKAVDDHVLAVIAAAIAEPRPGPPGDPVAEVGQRVTSLIGQHPHVVDYLGRALIDGAAIGSTIFDALVATGKARWDQSRARQLVRIDLDDTWAALNPLILVLGTVILRGHVDRHLPKPFNTPAQLRRWENAVNALIRDGQFRRGP